MYTPPIDNEIPDFPVGKLNIKLQLPPIEKIEIGDIIIARYEHSRWADFLPWEDWHHAALVSEINPLKIIEAIGPNSGAQWSGPTEVEFSESVGFGKARNIEEMVWLKPVFPHPIREVAPWNIPRRQRKIITTEEAKRRVVNYAKKQLGEKYSLRTTKWNENTWYCSLIVYKSFSRTVTGMYLESYDDIRAGFFITPEDLIKNKWTQQYFAWNSTINALLKV